MDKIPLTVNAIKESIPPDLPPRWVFSYPSPPYSDNRTELRTREGRLLGYYYPPTKGELYTVVFYRAGDTSNSPSGRVFVRTPWKAAFSLWLILSGSSPEERARDLRVYSRYPGKVTTLDGKVAAGAIEAFRRYLATRSAASL